MSKKACFAGLVLSAVLSQCLASNTEYSQVITSDNPVYYETFDSGGQTGWSDVSLVAGRVGQAGSFNGTSSTIDLGRSISQLLNAKTAVTIEAWINNASIPDGEDFTIFSASAYQQSRSRFRDSLVLQFNGPNIHAGARSCGDDDFQSATAAFTTTSEWHYVAAIFDFSQKSVSIYIDGHLAGRNSSAVFGSSQYTPGGDTGANPDTIGSHFAADRFFDGMIDELAVYGYALSDTQISEHFSAAPIHTPEPSALATVLTGGICVLFKKKIRKTKASLSRISL